MRIIVAEKNLYGIHANGIHTISSESLRPRTIAFENKNHCQELRARSVESTAFQHDSARQERCSTGGEQAGKPVLGDDGEGVLGSNFIQRRLYEETFV